MDLPPLQPGDTLQGKYVIKALLGSGGMGKVYEAVHGQIEKKVAIKLLNPEFSGDELAVTRFQREAVASASIGHHGIIDIYDIGVSEQGAPFLVMELLEGRTLSAALEALGRLDEPTTAVIVCQVLSALAAAHDTGIVHRDLKPDNIFLVDVNRPLPEVKLLDFGISKMLAGPTPSQSLTMTGAILGTPFYMSPEQARGSKSLDNRVDIWAVGAILYQCLTGQLPFTGDSYNEVLAKILVDDVPRPRRLVPEISAELEAIVLRALTKAREDRYGSALELMVDLLPFVDERHTDTISMTSELRDSVSALGRTGLSGAPALLGDSAERRSKAASHSPRVAQSDTELATGETLLSDSRSDGSGDLRPSDGSGDLRRSDGSGDLRPSDGSGDLRPSDSFGDPRSRGPSLRVIGGLGALGALGLVLIGALVLALSGLGEPREVASQPPTPEVPPPRPGDRAQPPPEAPSKASSEARIIELRVAVVPTSATISIDDRALEGNPVVTKLPADGAEHRVRAEAPGYETKTWSLVFDEDRDLAAVLAPRRARPGKTPPSPPAAGDDDDPWSGGAKVPAAGGDDPWGAE